MPLLNATTLSGLPSVAATDARPHWLTTPTHDRAAAHIGVVHLGLGAFQRAHQAIVFDALLQGGDTRWGVLGVAMRSTELADALAAQDGLYAVQIASAEGVRWQVVARCCAPVWPRVNRRRWWLPLPPPPRAGSP